MAHSRSINLWRGTISIGNLSIETPRKFIGRQCLCNYVWSALMTYILSVWIVAHKEALKKEVQGLRQLYNQQKQPQQHMQYMQPRPLLSKDSDLPLNFSKLDLGPPIPKPKSLDTHSSGPTKFSSGKPSPLYSAGSVVPTPSWISNPSDMELCNMWFQQAAWP